MRREQDRKRKSKKINSGEKILICYGKVIVKIWRMFLAEKWNPFYIYFLTQFLYNLQFFLNDISPNSFLGGIIRKSWEQNILVYQQVKPKVILMENLKCSINPFLGSAPVRYPLKTPESLCFQGISKGNIE